MLEQATFTFSLPSPIRWTVNGYSRRYTHVEVSFDREATQAVILYGVGQTKYTVPFRDLNPTLKEYIQEASKLLPPKPKPIQFNFGFKR